MGFSEITNKTLSDYNIDWHKLSVKKAMELLHATRVSIACNVSTMIGSSNAKLIMDEITDLEWKCILLQEFITKLQVNILTKQQ